MPFPYGDILIDTFFYKLLLYKQGNPGHKEQMKFLPLLPSPFTDADVRHNMLYKTKPNGKGSGYNRRGNERRIALWAQKVNNIMRFRSKIFVKIVHCLYLML